MNSERKGRNGRSRDLIELRPLSPVTKVKVKFTLNKPRKPREGADVELYCSLTSALDGGGWSTPRPGCFTLGKDQVPIVHV